jgi:hypothetical protein
VLSRLKPRASRKPNTRLVSTCAIKLKNFKNTDIERSRVGQLEHKLDGLLSAIQHIQANSSAPSPSQPQVNNSEAPSAPVPTQYRDQTEHTDLRLAPIADNDASDRRNSAASGSSLSLPPVEQVEGLELIPGVQITYLEAERALKEYTLAYYPHFPFVPIRPGLTAYDFNRRQPFLFRTIVQVSMPQSPHTQKSFKRWFRERIAQLVLVDQEKRLELLQALLVYLSWYAPRCFFNRLSKLVWSG